MSYMIYALLRLYKRATRTCGGGSYISEEISKMVGAFSENKAFGIRVNKLGGDICRRIWETMHLINNFLKCCQRFKEFYDGGWLLLESLLVESQMGVRVTVFYCPENHSLLRFKELGIAHIVILPKFHVLMVKQLISKPPKDETKSRPRTKNPYLLKADTRSGVEIENRDEYLPLSIMLSILELAKAMPFLSKTHPKQAETYSSFYRCDGEFLCLSSVSSFTTPRVITCGPMDSWVGQLIEIVSANNIGNWGKACGNDSNPNAAASAEIQPTLQCWNVDDQIFIVQYLHHCHDPTRSLLDRCQEEMMNPMLELLRKLKKMDIADRLSALSELADQDLEDGDHTSDQHVKRTKVQSCDIEPAIVEIHRTWLHLSTILVS
ncbi:hypothetical protein F2Q68_00003219 [Brassica cretica]|uniref:Uncharacterized protein n=1 Tax=Brassica cretica TaxID=69181 RepID=A0A8S9JB14_BRACR|nr:hypothetical protein F2Q68_00003219 [Brassica cretica]